MLKSGLVHHFELNVHAPSISPQNLNNFLSNYIILEDLFFYLKTIYRTLNLVAGEMDLKNCVCL
jgi:hypothetical protein